MWDWAEVTLPVHPDDRVRLAAAGEAWTHNEPVRVRYRLTRANDGALRGFDTAVLLDAAGLLRAVQPPDPALVGVRLGAK